MKPQLFKCFITAAIFGLVALNGNAQLDKSTVRIRLDSLQRIVLYDSLRLEPEVISAVFSIRNSFWDQSESIYKSKEMTDSLKTISLRQIRKETSETLYRLLGQQRYDKYKELIRRRAMARGAKLYSPLAGD